MSVKIKTVLENSYAEKAGLIAGDTIVAIDSNPIMDMLDYEFYSAKTNITIKYTSNEGEQEVTVEKDEYTPLGCDFETYLIDKHHSCKNKCVFCFVDQLPDGMRESLYFKDDDERLSFLFGNYITLTNLSDAELERIKEMHISPVNISVHTVDPDLRVKMMGNRFAGDVLEKIKSLASAGIDINTQLVLCRGINDGEYLKQSLAELTKLYPQVLSVASVPIGITSYREGLEPLEIYDAKSAGEVIDIITQVGDEMMRKFGERVVYPSDEWYLIADREMPAEEFYCGYPQLDNGVGMWRAFHDEFMAELSKTKRSILPRRVDTVTGDSAYSLISTLASEMNKKHHNIKVNVHNIKNNFFGGNVTVTGLLTGKDIIEQCKGKLTSKTLLLPSNTLRSEQDVLLDNVTVANIEQELGVKVKIVPQDGTALVHSMMEKA